MAAKAKGKSKKSAARTTGVKDLRVHKTNAHKVKGGMTPGPEQINN